jgi:oligopeptide transport system ATP-binding protein
MSASTSPVKNAVVEVEGLRVEFRTRSGWARAVDDVSFRLTEGRTMAVLGESGSGKSATARAMLGVLPKPQSRVTAGSIRVAGRDMLAMSEDARRDVRGAELAMVFQDALSALHPVLPVGYQIAEGARRHLRLGRREARERAIEMLSLVGIPDPAGRVGDYPHQFSGGMRQRVMIAMALAADPVVLVADEPTTALDVTIQAQLLDLLQRLKDERSMAMLLITHDMGVVAQAADDITVMYAGRVVEQGPADVVLGQPAHPYTRALLQSVPRPEHKGRTLPVIPGSPPDIAYPPQGCAFNPRCQQAVPECLTAPPMVEVSPGHFSRCHLAGLPAVLPIPNVNGTGTGGRHG